MPGKDVQLTIDLDVQRIAEESLAQGMDGARALPQRERRVEVRELPCRRGLRRGAGLGRRVGRRDGVGADVRPGRVRRRHLRRGVRSRTRTTADNPLAQPGDPGPVRARLDVQAHHLDRRARDGPARPRTRRTTTRAASSSPTAPSGATPADREHGTGRPRRVRSRSRATSTSTSSAVTCGSATTSGGRQRRTARRRATTSCEQGYAIQDTARKYGFGEPTGIGLAGEAAGRIPDQQWKEDFNQNDSDPRQRLEYSLWLPGDNINLAVGQGDLLVTPLQLASAYSTFVDGGTLFTPRLASAILEPGTGTDQPPVPFRALPAAVGEEGRASRPTCAAPIMAGLVGAVEGRRDRERACSPTTRRARWRARPAPPRSPPKQDTSLFVGITNVDTGPRYVVTTVVEEAGFGAGGRRADHPPHHRRAERQPGAGARAGPARPTRPSD